MDKGPFSLNELADRTGLEPRTIRRYIAEGLLRGPESLGRNAHYTSYHLSRLLAIRELREQGNLSIAEIRRYLLMAPDDEDIHVIPIRPGAMASPRDRAARRDEDFAAYEAPPLAASAVPRQAQPPMERIIAALNRIAAGRPRSEGQVRAVHEFEVTPDISLNVRGDFRTDELRQFERLAAALRSLLLGGVREDDNE